MQSKPERHLSQAVTVNQNGRRILPELLRNRQLCLDRSIPSKTLGNPTHMALHRQPPHQTPPAEQIVFPHLVETKKTDRNGIENPADSPDIRPRRPQILHPLPIQTHPPNPLPLQPLARMQQPRSASVRNREPPADGRASARGALDPLVRGLQRRDRFRGDHAGALRWREDGRFDSRECAERGGGGVFCNVCLDDGAEGEVCW